MATLNVTGRGTIGYTGKSTFDKIDFNTSAAATLTVGAANILRTGPTLKLQAVGSRHADTLEVRAATDVDASKVTFGADWTGLDTLVLRDTTAANKLTGSARGDRLVVTGGSDDVEGGGGTDTLTLSYAATTAALTSSVAGGDRVISATGGPRVSFSGIERLSAELGSGNDVVTGLSGADALSGNNGNDTLSGGDGDDSLKGGAGADTLTGNKGRDTMNGGSGNDTFVVDSLADVVVEAADGGIDTVRTAITYDLSALAHVENVTLTGSSDATAVGNGRANALTGNAGANVLIGEGGRDTLAVGGDADSDVIALDDPSQSTGINRDLVTGFDGVGEDLVFLSDVIVDAIVFTGNATLNHATFDADIAREVDAALKAGGPVQAALFIPAMGNQARAGDSYLVVDADNDGLYRAGEDYVLQFRDRLGTFDLNDLL